MFSQQLEVSSLNTSFCECEVPDRAAWLLWSKSLSWLGSSPFREERPTRLEGAQRHATQFHFGQAGGAQLFNVVFVAPTVATIPTSVGRRSFERQAQSLQVLQGWQ